MAQGVWTPAVHALEDHLEEKPGCHACQSTASALEEKPAWDELLGTQPWDHFRAEVASLQDYVDHFTEAYSLLQFAVGDADLHLLLRHEMQLMSKNSKGYFMTEEDASSLCLMTYIVGEAGSCPGCQG